MGVVVLEKYSFALPNHWWLPTPLYVKSGCPGMLISRWSNFLWRMMPHKTLNLGFSGISLFRRKWWSWKDHVEVELLLGCTPRVMVVSWNPRFWCLGGCRFLWFCLLSALCLYSWPSCHWVYGGSGDWLHSPCDLCYCSQEGRHVPSLGLFLSSAGQRNVYQLTLVSPWLW